MQRISTEQDGVFKNGVPGVSRGTKVNAAWFNAVQEELCYLIEHCGITLDPAVNTQLYSALREAIEGIFEDSLIVNSSQVAGKRVTIDSESIDIDGVEMKSVLINDVITLVVDETVKLLKNLIVLGDLSVDGRVNIGGGVVALSALLNQLTVNGSSVFNNLVSFNGNAVFNFSAAVKALEADHATFKAAVSTVDDSIALADQVSFEISDSVFSNGKKRIRAVVVSGVTIDAGTFLRVVNITANPVNGRFLHVVNRSLNTQGFVTVQYNSNVLCVLAPGSDRWFCAIGDTTWAMDESTIG